MEERCGMRASRSLNIGEAIMPPVLPIAFSLYRSKMGSHCSSCCRKVNLWTKYRCADKSCPTLYCSSPCQENDSGAHILECELRQILERRSFVGIYDNKTADLRLAVKILHLMEQNEGFDFLSKYGARDFINDFEIEIEILQEVKTRPVLFWKQVLNIISINKVVLEDLDHEIGVGIFPKIVSYINHSCSPNVLLHIESAYFTNEWSIEPFPPSIVEKEKGDISQCRPHIVGIAVKEIKKGEEVFVSYTDLLQPKDIRRKKLRETHNISCLCERCFMGIDYILEKHTSCLPHGDLPEEMASTFFCLDNYEDGRAILNAFLMHFLNGDPLNVQWAEKQIICDGCLRLHHHNYECYLIYIKLIEIVEKMKNMKESQQKFEEAFVLHKEYIAFSILIAGLFNQLFNSDLAFIGIAGRHFQKIAPKLIADANVSLLPEDCVDETFPKTKEEVMEAAKVYTEGIYDLVQGIWPTLIEDIPCLHGIKHPLCFNGLCGDSGLSSRDNNQILRDLGILCHKYGKFLMCLGYGQHSQVINKVQIETIKSESDRKSTAMARGMGRGRQVGDDERAAKNVDCDPNDGYRSKGCSGLCWRRSWREM